MSRISMARAIVVIAAAVVLAVTISAGARTALRAGVGAGGLAAAMLDTGDLTAGSQPDASLTGPLTSERARRSALTPASLAPTTPWCAPGFRRAGPRKWSRPASTPGPGTTPKPGSPPVRRTC